MFRQKSRESWLHLGDRNSKFFHSIVKVKTARNHISSLISDNGSPISNHQELKDMASEFYKKLFNHTGYWNLFPKLVPKRRLTAEAATWMERDVNAKEIQKAVFDIHPEKAPGPDGYNALFFQKNWKVVGEEVTQAVQSFFETGKLLKAINHTFVTLMPKIPSASSLTDYRPISCCNVLYKIITKVLSNRLKTVIGKLVSEHQSAFIKGRMISDTALLAHELVRDFNNPMGSRICLKVDLQKAFDNANREFIYFIMHCVGFNRKWISWIRACIENPSFSIMLNGSPSGYFTSN